MLTGSEPYEELLAEVRCPPLLKTRLQSLWETGDESSQYAVIESVIASVSDPNDDACTAGNVLYDTIYRYLVLLGVPNDFSQTDVDMPWRGNAVWNTLADCLALSGTAVHETTRYRRSNNKKLEACAQQFATDSSMWNAFRGSHSIMEK